MKIDNARDAFATAVLIFNHVGEIPSAMGGIDATPTCMSCHVYMKPEFSRRFLDEPYLSPRDVAVLDHNVLRSHDVTVEIVPYQSRRDTHARYAIDAVPCLVVADAAGAVRTGFLGPVTATDLWAAVAEARAPGSVDRSGGCDRHQHQP